MRYLNQLMGIYPKNGSYFLMSWNNGNSNFSNKRDDISVTLDRHSSDIFAIHEANFNTNRDKGFQKYNIEAKYPNSDYSTDARTILLLRQGIIFNRRHDLEDKHISTIWVEILISKRKSLLVCAYYRQWSLPTICNVPNSNSPTAQKDRYTLYSEQLKKASMEGKDIIILTDENINSLDDNCNTTYYRNIELKIIRDNNIINYNLIYHNNQPTFIRKAQKSCIDFIISNCPSKINNVRTHYDDNYHYQYKDINYCNILSDHIIISCRYSNNSIKS